MGGAARPCPPPQEVLQVAPPPRPIKHSLLGTNLRRVPSRRLGMVPAATPGMSCPRQGRGEGARKVGARARTGEARTRASPPMASPPALLPPSPPPHTHPSAPRTCTSTVWDSAPRGALSRWKMRRRRASVEYLRTGGGGDRCSIKRARGRGEPRRRRARELADGPLRELGLPPTPTHPRPPPQHGVHHKGDDPGDDGVGPEAGAPWRDVGDGGLVNAGEDIIERLVALVPLHKEGGGWGVHEGWWLSDW